MTGIAAIVSAAPDLRERLGQMAASLQQRPHDLAGVWDGDGAGLAAAALQTTAQMSDCQLPLQNEDGSVALVFDGYLSNYEELRRDLGERGDRLRSAADAELVLRAYERWGEGCTAYLDGEYALIVADQRAKGLFCARDHQGLRPLYYLNSGDEVLVASDVATILSAARQQPEINPFFLAQIVAATIVAPEETAWKGVMRVPGASQIVFRNGRAKQSRHYIMPTEVTRLRRSPEDCVAEYRDMLSDAVRRASRTKGPLAVELSGGLDSSALSALAWGLHTDGKLQAPSVRAYTMRGEPGSRADEIEFARAAARYIGVDLTELPLFQPPIGWFLEQTAIERDIASYPNGVQSLALEQSMVTDGARVVLNGNGGDQWLDGSRGYVEQNLQALQFGRFGRNARDHIREEGAARAVPTIARRAVLNLLPDRMRNRLRRMRGTRQSDDVNGSGLLARSYADRLGEAFRQNEARYPADPIARTKLKTFDSSWTHFANDLMNRQRARVGIEGRSPMLSRPFIEFCCSLPEDLKLRFGQRRWVHRQALGGLLPEAILKRTTKAEFPARHEVDEILALIRKGMTPVVSNLVDQDRLAELSRSELRHEFAEDWSFELWGLFIVSLMALENCSSID